MTLLAVVTAAPRINPLLENLPSCVYLSKTEPMTPPTKTSPPTIPSSAESDFEPSKCRIFLLPSVVTIVYPSLILFNAGSGHGEAMDEFLKGPEALTIEISVYADRLVDETLNRLLDNDQNDEAVLRQMALYSRLFSEPHQVGPYNTLTNGVDEG